MNKSHLLGAVCTLFLCFSASSNSALVQATYEITASDFLDSNANPPTPPSSNFVTGTYTFTFDTDIPQQNEIMPDGVTGLDITRFDGVIVDYDETNSGVNTDLNIFTDSGRITIGGNTTTVGGMVGLTDDFRVQFDITLSTFEVSAVVENLVWNSITDPFYNSTNTSVTLLNATTVPLLPAFWLFGSGLLGLIGIARRKKA